MTIEPVLEFSVKPLPALPQAAELLMTEDPTQAKSVLVALMSEPDLAIRRGAGRVIQNLTPPDLELFRRLLRDREPWVRMYGAGAVLKAAANGF